MSGAGAAVADEEGIILYSQHFDVARPMPALDVMAVQFTVLATGEWKLMAGRGRCRWQNIRATSYKTHACRVEAPREREKALVREAGRKERLLMMQRLAMIGSAGPGAMVPLPLPLPLPKKTETGDADADGRWRCR
jgi:hypothetical protein